jgi:hypothetical protein
VAFFADHVRVLTDIYDSKLADAGHPLFGWFMAEVASNTAGMSV